MQMHEMLFSCIKCTFLRKMIPYLHKMNKLNACTLQAQSQSTRIQSSVTHHSTSVIYALSDAYSTSALLFLPGLRSLAGSLRFLPPGLPTGLVHSSSGSI